MKETVDDWCRSCQVCAQRKGKRKRDLMGSNKVGGPFERVGLDIVGPVPTTAKETAISSLGSTISQSTLRHTH